MENDLSSYGSLGRIISSKGRGSRGINGPFHGLVAEFSVPRQKKLRITSAEKIQTQFYLDGFISKELKWNTVKSAVGVNLDLTCRTNYQMTKLLFVKKNKFFYSNSLRK